MVAVISVVTVGIILYSGVAWGSPEPSNYTRVGEEEVRQMVWKRCALQLTPDCLKLTLTRLVDRLETTYFQPLPGVVLSSNRSRSLQEASRAGSSGILTEKVVEYLRSLTLSVRLSELPTFNTTDFMNSVVTNVTGRKNKGNNGLLAVGLMMGGSMMTMMMAALAAMSGKALMTAMVALMLAGLGSMKGGGGGKSTTYEVIAQPEVSHMHTHSSEVHHGHGWKRSLNAQDLVYMSHSLGSSGIKT